MRGLVLVVASLLPLSAFAQQSPGGRITGSILCADTHAPARFARVTLKPVTLDTAAADQQVQRMQDQRAKAATISNQRPAPPMPQAQLDQMRTSFARSIYNNQEQRSASTADIDGRYALTGIQPGTYFVQVDMPGYVDPVAQFSFQDITNPDPNVRAHIAQSVPLVTIVGSEEQRLDLRLERGASVSGRILFEDGAPAVGWNISAIPASNLTKKDDPNASSSPAMPALIGGIGSFGSFTVQGISALQARTDDIGGFRISGLPPGEYAIRAQLIASEPGRSAANMGAPLRLTVYSGNALHAADAKSFPLVSGQARNGEDLTVVLHSLHNIRGKVTAKSDGHSINSGRITVAGTDDPTVTSSASINEDGSFEVYSLPPGAYKVTVAAAADTQPSAASPDAPPGFSRPANQTIHSYGTDSTSVALGDTDATGVNFAVPDRTNRTAASNSGNSQQP